MTPAPSIKRMRVRSLLALYGEMAGATPALAASRAPTSAVTPSADTLPAPGSSGVAGPGDDDRGPMKPSTVAPRPPSTSRRFYRIGCRIGDRVADRGRTSGGRQSVEFIEVGPISVVLNGVSALPLDGGYSIRGARIFRTRRRGRTAVRRVQVSRGRNRNREARLVDLADLRGRHVVNFLAAQRVDELLAFVEREIAQLALVADDMRSQEDDQIVLLLVARLVAEQVPDHRDVGDERNPLVMICILAGEQAADYRGAMVLDQHAWSRRTGWSWSDRACCSRCR